MNVTKERRDAIRAAAETATPGPYFKRGDGELAHSAGALLFTSTNNLDHFSNCDPKTILALLDALDVAEAERDTLRDDHAVMANYVRPLIPPGQNPDQATNVYAWVGMLAETRKRADAAEAKMGEPATGALAQATELANNIWSDLDDVRRDTNLTDAWASVAEGAGRDILAFAAALYAAPPAAEPVKVKPLEWRDITSQREDGPAEPTGDIEALTVIGEYSVYIDDAAIEDGGKDWMWCVWAPDESLGHFGDLDEAKAAAQADYEARIRSALVSEAETE